MKKFLLLCVIGVLSASISCEQSNAELIRSMNRAEELMMESPDSALTILSSIDVNELSTQKDRARYAILYTQAKDKNYIDETDTTLISEAKRYYEDSNNHTYKFLSCFYYGRVLCNNGDYFHAMIAYTEAEDVLDKLNNDYFAGLLYTEIGNIYRLYYDYNKCLDAYQSAYKHYTLSELEPHKAYALLDIGISYWPNIFFEQALW